MRFDLDAFKERAAIAEFCGGMSRFEAETLAAKQQGMARWQALQLAKEVVNANRGGNTGGSSDQADAMGGQRNEDRLSAVQRQPEEENRPMPERDAQAGRDRGVLPSLRIRVGGAV